jgi:hypothetical protein
MASRALSLTHRGVRCLMPYFNRLLEDSGVSIPSGRGPSGVVSRPETTVASPEVVDTVEIGPPPAATAANTETFVAESRPAPATAPSSAVEAAASSPRPLEPASTSLPLQVISELATPRCSDSTQAPPPSSVAASDARSPEESASTSAERILRTLAAVRYWAAATPAPGEPVAEAQVIEQEETVVVDRNGEPRGEVVLTPPARGMQPADEPEVVNLSMSIGSIELTIDGHQPTEPAPTSQSPGKAAPGPDAVARLRKHYYRPPIGW